MIKRAKSEREKARVEAKNRTLVIYGLSVIAEAATIEKLEWLIGGLGKEAQHLTDDLSAISALLLRIGTELKLQGESGLAHLPKRRLTSRLAVTAEIVPPEKEDTL